jgi:hypothetical protein
MPSGACRLSRNFARVRDYRSIEGVERATFVKNLINLYSEVLGFLSAGIMRYVRPAGRSARGMETSAFRQSKLPCRERRS